MSAESDTVASQGERAAVSSFYEPLRDGAFRLFWCAAVVSITVIWMHDLGTVWFMRELTNADPFMVSLIQAAASLPVMLLSLPMGTLGDLWDRRRFLLTAHLWLLIVTVVFLIVALRGAATPWRLVTLTALMGIGKAMLLPGLAAVIPQLVSRRDLPLGVGLYSMANNLGRIVGPAIAGVIIVASGVAAVYTSSIVLLLVSLVLLLIWRPPARAPQRKTGYLEELHAGLVYCVSDRQFRSAMGRLVIFFACAASVHALLPVLVNDPTVFGISWGAYGVGAVTGAVLFPRFSQQGSAHHQLSLGIFAHAIGLGLLASVTQDWLRVPVMLFMGLCWFGVMSTAQVSVQMVLPEQLRARGMGAFTVMVMAGVGLGAPLWGFVAKIYSPSTSIFLAMALSLLGLAITRHLKFHD
jgi:MFS family permease